MPAMNLFQVTHLFQQGFKRIKFMLKKIKGMEEKHIFRKIKRHNTIAISLLEPDDIVLVFRNTLRYILLGIILLCLLGSW